SALYLPTLTADIIDKGVIPNDHPYIYRTGALMVLVTALGSACSIAAGYLSSRSAVGWGRIIRARIFAHVEQFSLHEFDTMGTATLITRSTNDVTQLQQFMAMALRMMLMAPIMFIGGVIVAASKDAPLTLVIVGVLPFLAGLIWFI